MEITRNSVETAAGPSEWFTGNVYIDAIARPTGPSRLSASSVHFTPGARTAWHTHPNGQTICVVEGVGLAQRRGGPIEAIRPGDRVFFEPDAILSAPGFPTIEGRAAFLAAAAQTAISSMEIAADRPSAPATLLQPQGMRPGSAGQETPGPRRHEGAS